MVWSLQDFPTEFCQVCLDVVPLSDTTALSACRHRFCVACIATHLNVQITDGETDLRCFFRGEAGACGAPIDPRDIENLVAPAMFDKYNRFVMAKSNDQSRQCPFCDHTQVTQGTAKDPRCVCSQCQRSFCFTHSNAHDESESCKQYETRIKRGERMSGRVVGKISKPCPKCARPIEKNGGCLHMRCWVCRTAFCWSCRKEWNFNYSSHHDPRNILSCPKIAEHIEPSLTSPRRPIRWLARFVYYLAMAIIALPLTVAFCWVWIPYSIVQEESAVFTRWRVLLVYIALLTTQGFVKVGNIVAPRVALLAKSVYNAFAFVGAGLLWPFKRLCRLSRQACSCRHERTPPEEETSTTFTSLEDGEE